MAEGGVSVVEPSLQIATKCSIFSIYTIHIYTYIHIHMHAYIYKTGETGKTGKTGKIERGDRGRRPRPKPFQAQSPV